MKAAYYTAYGDANQLTLRDVPIPTPAEDELLVRVLSVSLNASDVEFLRGKPAYTRMWGPRRPKYPTLGSDCAGIVESVGSKVTRFRPGDRVLGDLLERWGCLAEYVTAPEKLWTTLPEALTPEVGSMLPQAGVVAWQSLHAAGPIQGKRVLINGAGGGSGTLAIQMAKHLGATQVIAVDGAEKTEGLRKLGADLAVDYLKEDYTTPAEPYDLIVDLVGSRTLAENARALNATGQYVLVGGSVPRLLAVLLGGALRSLFSKKRYRLLVVRQSTQAIQDVVQLCIEGKVAPILGQSFPLAEVRAAFGALGCLRTDEAPDQLRILGKVVVLPCSKG